MVVRVAELFAGVGGFRRSLPEPDFRTIWSNQWEPREKAQWASKCYTKQFGADGHSNEDISSVEATAIPDHDLLVGGFPCQDYSVATTRAAGIQGKKGVLWWEIDRIIRGKKPGYILLENVDRLLRSPTAQRGRDFAIVLRCLNNAGYHVEWRALNAAQYGFPQKRRRVFIFAAHKSTAWGKFMGEFGSAHGYLQLPGFFAREFPVEPPTAARIDSAPDVVLPTDLQILSNEFDFHFLQSGVSIDGEVWTAKPKPIEGDLMTLREILETNVAESYFVPDADVPRWKYLKGSKSEERKSATGHEYHYKEGAIPFPDHLDQPARTILTQEGGRTPSRFNHLILDPQVNRFRRLTPEEAEKLNGFPAGWTSMMPERRRYFCMGNALVIGLVQRMGKTLHATRQDPSKGMRGALRKMTGPTHELPLRAR